MWQSLQQGGLVNNDDRRLVPSMLDLLPYLPSFLVGVKSHPFATMVWWSASHGMQAPMLNICVCGVYCCRRYVLPTAFNQLAARRAGVSDQWLAAVLQQLNSKLRSRLGSPQRRALAARDMVECLQLLALGADGASAAQVAAAAAADLPGRQSGAEAWRAARGETGGGLGRSCLLATTLYPPGLWV